MEVLLDTNFIISSVKQKVDFFSLANEKFSEKIEWMIPYEVIQEIEKLKITGSPDDRLAAKISLEMIKVILPKIVNVKNKNVDQGIIDYIKDSEIVLATLDSDLKKKVKNKIMSIRSLKDIEIN